MPEKIIEQQPVLSANAAMFRVMCWNNDGTIWGKISNACINDPVPFHGLGDMLLKIDDICENNRFPMSSNERRSLCEHTPDDRNAKGGEISENWKKYSPYEFMRSADTENKGSIEKDGWRFIFLIHVQCRYGASMQGLVVQKCTPARKAHFRSGLELIHLINDVVKPDARPLLSKKTSWGL